MGGQGGEPLNPSGSTTDCMGESLEGLESRCQDIQILLDKSAKNQFYFPTKAFFFYFLLIYIGLCGRKPYWKVSYIDLLQANYQFSS